MERGRFDSVSLAGIAVFSALATLLAALSQFLGLNFPVLPYLQFDFGEIAIVMAFFMFGPMPAATSCFVEFVALLYFGQNVPIGPALKLFALLSTVAGMWLGSAVAMRMKAAGVGKVVAFSGVVGSVVRASVMTVPNYVYLLYLVSQYTLGGVEDTLKASFALVGVTLSDANALAWILGFTAVFNVIQLLIVVGLSYSVLRFPPVSNLRVGGRAPWFVSLTGGKARPQATAQ